MSDASKLSLPFGWTRTVIYFALMGINLTAGMHGANAQNECVFYLANHSIFNQGINLSLVVPADSNGLCALTSVQLDFGVGDGTKFHDVTISPPSSWQPGVTYTAEAMVSASGPQLLLLDSQPLATNKSAFQPAQEPFFASLLSISGAATQTFLVSQISLQATNGSNTLLLLPNSNNPIPLVSVLMSGPASWQQEFTENASQTTIIDASFQFDAIPTNTNQFLPLIDSFGQVTFNSWSNKVATSNDLFAAITEEQAWLATNAPPMGRDIYGGSIFAVWTNKATSYFYAASHDNRWWLISPLGNPLFYIGLTGVYECAGSAGPVTRSPHVLNNSQYYFGDPSFRAIPQDFFRARYQ